MKISEYKLEHWAAAFLFFVATAIAWTIVGHYTEKWLSEKVDS